MIFGERRLFRNETLFISRGTRGEVLACLEGTVWVTCEGCPRDLVLAAGEGIYLWGRRGVCVQALGEAKVARARNSNVTIPNERHAG